MNDQGVRTALEAVLAADPDVADRDELAEMVAAVSRVRSMLDGFEVRCARRSRQLAEAGRSEPAGALLGREGRRSSKEANTVSERAEAAEAMPGFEDALNGGSATAGHLDAIAAATRSLDDDQQATFRGHEAALLAAAAGEGVDAFRRRCRRLARQIVAQSSSGSDAEEYERQRKGSCVKRWVDKITGMHHTHLELDPLRDAALWSVVDDTTRQLRNADGNAGMGWGELQAEAFVAAVSASVTNPGRAGTASSAGSAGSADAAGSDGDAGDSAAEPGSSAPDAVSAEELRAVDAIGRRVPEATVLVELAVLLGGFDDNGVCETEDGIALPVSVIRRLCCDAEIIPAVMGADGELLELGRSARTANRAQRRALRSMHRGCIHPDCTVGFSATKAHHVKWWWRDNGPTDISNLVPLCERHHHLVHEGGWTLTMTPDRVVTWTRPDGKIYWTGPTIDRSPVAVRR